MAIVFRIEAPNGEGPYYYGDGDRTDAHWLLKHHSWCSEDSVRHWPCPDYDEGIGRSKKHEERCAFTSMRKLRLWFSEVEIVRLCGMGFRLVKHVGVTITARGRRQCLFTGNNPTALPAPAQMAFEFEIPKGR